jgi:hypothetical protein
MSILSVNFAQTSDKLDSILEVCALEAALPWINTTASARETTSRIMNPLDCLLVCTHDMRMASCLQPEPMHPSAPLTRLVATLGPNSSSVEQLTALLQAGMQVPESQTSEPIRRHHHAQEV